MQTYCSRGCTNHTPMRYTFFLLFILSVLKGFSQSFEGKLTYISESEHKIDTIFVAVRSDSFRIQFPDRTNASLFIYFVGHNTYAYYSKRDDVFIFNSLSERNSGRQVFTYNTVSVGDTLQLNYLANVPAPEGEVSEVGATIYLDKQLPLSNPTDTLIDYYVFNGSGYVAKEGYSWFKYKSANKRFHFKLIQVDFTKPDVELFSTKSKKQN